MVENNTHDAHKTDMHDAQGAEAQRQPGDPQTMGHEWDGIAEFNNPLPRWWVIVFMVCIVWAVGYAVLMPSVPGGNSFFSGLLGYSSRANVRDDVVVAAQNKDQWLTPMQDVTTEEILNNPELQQFAMRGGEVIFKENCAACHMVGGAGAKGYPALVDDEWIWGGKLADIEMTIRHGIRWLDDENTRDSLMPSFGADGILDRTQIGQVADYVLSLSDPEITGTESGKMVYADNCAVCHGESAEGVAALGAPPLNNGIWLYGGTRNDIMMQVMKPAHGQMPSWVGRLSDVDIKQVTVYVHSLGGGQ
jgi:cytochrome c oxidase cbb3-type subunit 3